MAYDVITITTTLKRNSTISVQQTLTNHNKINHHILYTRGKLFKGKITDSKACFKRRATAVPSSIARIKFDFSTAVARCLKPSRATRQ